MNEIRYTFNNMIVQKFQRLSRAYRKNEKIIRLFYEAIIDADDDQEEIEIPEGNRDELAAAFLKKIEKVLF